MGGPLGREKNKEKKHKQNVHGIVLGFSSDFDYMFSPVEKDPQNQHKQNLLPAQSQENPPNLFMLMCVSFPDVDLPFSFLRPPPSLAPIERG